MTQPLTPLSLLAAFWPTYTARNQQTSHNLTATTGAFWQSTSAFWETFTSLGRQHSAALTILLAQTPQWQQRFADCKTPADITATWAAYTQSLGTTATALTTDALAQRAWLLQQWQFLGQRARQSTSSSTTGTQTHANAGTTANENFTPSYSNAASSGSYAGQPQGTFIPGPANQTRQATGTPASTPIAMPSPKAASFGAMVTQPKLVPIPASVPLTSRSIGPATTTTATVTAGSINAKTTQIQPTQQPLEAMLTPTATPISSLNVSSMPAFSSPVISSTATSVSRTSSTTASTTTSTAARRSVVASRRARAARRPAVARAR